MDAVVRTSLSEPRFQTTLLASFAVLAILLAGAGVHAVVAFETNQRTQELGVRVALGASRRNVFRHAVGRSNSLRAARHCEPWRCWWSVLTDRPRTVAYRSYDSRRAAGDNRTRYCSGCARKRSLSCARLTAPP